MRLSFYRLDSGQATGAGAYVDPCTPEAIARLTPSGCGAYLGTIDHHRQRVNLQTGQLEPWQPPAPEADSLRTWAWDAAAWQWVPVPTDRALDLEARDERARRLAACDWIVARSSELGEPVPAPWSAYRQALRDLTRQAGFPRVIVWPDPPA